MSEHNHEPHTVLQPQKWTRFRCARKSLVAAVARVMAAVPRRKVGPIIRGLKFSANGKTTVQATDLEVGIVLDVPAETLQEGEAVINAKQLQGLLKGSTEAELTLTADIFGAEVQGERSAFALPADNPDDFPGLPEWQEQSWHEIEAATLLAMHNLTTFAAADGESARFAMTGVLWELDGDRVRLVATDGRRLAQTDGPARCVNGHTTVGKVQDIIDVEVPEVDGDGNPVLDDQGNATWKKEQRTISRAALVPVKAMELLARQLKDSDNVLVSFRENEVLFRTFDAVIYSRLVDGRFPDYRQVYPRKSGNVATLKTAEFLAAVKQAETMTDEEMRRTAFAFEDGKVTLTTKSAGGVSSLALGCRYEGKPLTINFNPGYIIDYLKLLPKKGEVSVALVDGATPALWTGADESKYLLMPLS